MPLEGLRTAGPTARLVVGLVEHALKVLSLARAGDDDVAEEMIVKRLDFPALASAHDIVDRAQRGDELDQNLWVVYCPAVEAGPDDVPPVAPAEAFGS